MTEETASTKVCPMTMNADKWERCLGQGCAAWRWLQSPEACRDTTVEPKGYCGLAGLPR